MGPTADAAGDDTGSTARLLGCKLSERCCSKGHQRFPYSRAARLTSRQASSRTKIENHQAPKKARIEAKSSPTQIPITSKVNAGPGFEGLAKEDIPTPLPCTSKKPAILLLSACFQPNSHTHTHTTNETPEIGNLNSTLYTTTSAWIHICICNTHTQLQYVK